MICRYFSYNLKASFRKWAEARKKKYIFIFLNIILTFYDKIIKELSLHPEGISTSSTRAIFISDYDDRKEKIAGDRKCLRPLYIYWYEYLIR